MTDDHSIPEDVLQCQAERVVRDNERAIFLRLSLRNASYHGTAFPHDKKLRRAGLLTRLGMWLK